MEVENEKQAELWVCENCGRNSEYYKEKGIEGIICLEKKIKKIKGGYNCL